MVDKTGSVIQPGKQGAVRPKTGVGSSGAAAAQENLHFQKMLEEMQAEKKKVLFSAHARERIESRNIELNADDMNRIEEAIDMVQAKGSRSSLLLYGEVALLASVTNRTIITAVDGGEDREKVFTGIDSAVIVK